MIFAIVAVVALRSCYTLSSTTRIEVRQLERYDDELFVITEEEAFQVKYNVFHPLVDVDSLQDLFYIDSTYVVKAVGFNASMLGIHRDIVKIY